MALRLFQVDAFTGKFFEGFPAAVCILTETKETAWLLTLASELNQPATAFLLKAEDGYTLRWFSPEKELNFCGHGTLASAYVLYQEGLLKRTEQARFYAYGGLLTAELREGNWIERRLPANPQGFMRKVPSPPTLLEGLAVAPRFVGTNKLDYLVEVDSEETVKNLQPNLASLATVPTRGIIVTSAAKGECEFVSRYFAPRAGVDEDAVCETSYCGLGPYWSDVTGQREFMAYHSAGRGGIVRVAVGAQTVHVSGQATILSRGELMT